MATALNSLQGCKDSPQLSTDNLNALRPALTVLKFLPKCGPTSEAFTMTHADIVPKRENTQKKTGIAPPVLAVMKSCGHARIAELATKPFGCDVGYICPRRDSRAEMC